MPAPMSPAQKRLVEKIKAGCVLTRHFDVWGGYWWTLTPTGERVPAATVKAMEGRGDLKPGEDKSIYSGYREMSYSLSASLEPSDDEGQPNP